MKAKAKRRKLNLDDVLTRIVQLLLLHPPSSITFSKVAQATGIPRATLYYYFGSERTQMIEEAVRFGMKSFVQAGTLAKRKRFRDWDSFQRARFQVSTRLVRKYPWAPGLYFRYRNDPGPIGKAVREVEAEFIRGISQVWERFHGAPPDERAAQLSSALKVGFLWGVSCRPESWFGEQTRKDKARFQAAVDLMTRISTEALRTVFDESPEGR